MNGHGHILLPPGGKTQTDVHGTPLDFFRRLDAEFGFTLDPCTDGSNALCVRYFTPIDDGLAQPWGTETVFMNPPYSDCGRWMHKAYFASLLGATVVCLVPVRTDTAWWHDYAMQGEVRFIRGRLRFGNAKTNAPFPSAVIVFRAYGVRA